MNEQVKNGVVICDNCNWKWNIADGGEDTYLCHKCNHDNTPINEHKSISLSNLFQEIINEAIKKDYIGQCDILRRNCTGEDNWQEMMQNKIEIPFNIFFDNVNMSNLLDDDESPEEFHQDNLRSDPDTKTFKSTWGGKDALFYQTAGFEFIFV